MSKISVLTPTIKGREKSLSECIKSVKDQTIAPYEHLVHVDVDRKGPSWCRNTLADMAQGDWLLFLDDDDIIDSDFIEHCLMFLEANDIVYTWCRKNFDYHIDIDFNPDELKVRNFIPVTALVRKSKFEEAGGFPDGPFEDWKLWLRLLDCGSKFFCTMERKWTYRRSVDGQWSKDITS